jgi:hypothetical protein
VDQEEPVTFTGQAVTSAPAVPDATPEDRAVTSGSSEANTDDAPSLPQVASTIPSPQPPTVTRADRKANAEKRSAAAKADSSRARTDYQERGAAKEPKRLVQAPQTEDAKRPIRAVAQPSSSEKAATSRSKAPSKRGNDKPATAQRTRVAAAQPNTGAASSPTAAAAPVVNEERLHLLGIPLPTGRKVRECLLEWRC